MKALLTAWVRLGFVAAILLSFVGGVSSAEKRAPEPAAKKPAVRKVGVPEFEKLRADTNSVVLDVRTQREYDAGHLPGAVHIDWRRPDFAKRVSELDRSKTYLVHCAVGGRSAEACEAMTKLNFTNVVNFSDGMKGWEKAGKPVERK
jgi:phage shock protein E